MSKAEQTGTRGHATAHGAASFGAPNGPEAAAARALAEAADAGDAPRVAALLASGAFADARLRGGETPLMRACARGYSDVARALLDAGADASARRADGFTPLILAAFFGHEETARLLLERGADASARTGLGTTAEKWAASRGFDGLTTLLRSASHGRARASADATHTADATKTKALSDATRAKASRDPLEEVGIFSRRGKAADSEVSREPVLSLMKIDGGAALKSEDDAAADAPSQSVEAPSREGKRSRDRIIISIRDDGAIPSHPSESAFSFGRFVRSWQASIGTAFLLAALGVGVYAVWRRGGAREGAKPAQQPAQVLPAQQPQPTPLAPDAQVSPTPDLNAYPMAGNASQPYYDPPVINNVPPSANIPNDLTVVSESGVPAAEDPARAKAKPSPVGTSPSPQPAREGDDSKPTGDARGDSERTARPPDAETRPTPRPTAQTPAPPSNPDRGKVIQWPPPQ